MTPRPGSDGLDAIAVVIPARDEEHQVAASIGALASAVAALPPDVAVHLTLVLDRCADRTPSAAARAVDRFLRAGGDRSGGVHASIIEPVRSPMATVGSLRHAGVEDAARRLGRRPDSVWLASTDADDAVPVGWLAFQLAVARAGIQALAGSIVVDDWTPWPAEVHRQWGDRYHRADRPAPVHGANLGLRLDAYDEVGGFAPLADGEDQDLFDRVRRTGRPTAVSTSHPVVTSSRRHARAPAGFSGYLRDLEAESGNPA